MKKLKAERESAGLQLSKEESSYLKEVSEVVASKINSAKSLLSRYKNFRKIFVKASDVLMTAGLTEVTLEAVRAFTSSDPDVLEAKATILEFLGDDLDLAGINEAIAYFNDQLKYNYNEEFDPRTIVGDNYADQDERHYGNNDVIGNDASHGTHVSGIIAAVRDNFIGIKGVATNVKVMAIRVVPNGDERDKDVANGIRYAVNNGAKIINMSFGKAFSPYKSVVDAAVRYAQSKGVLLVHAAGNDSENNDVSANFPNRKDLLSKTEFTNWLDWSFFLPKRG